MKMATQKSGSLLDIQNGKMLVWRTHFYLLIKYIQLFTKNKSKSGFATPKRWPTVKESQYLFIMNICWVPGNSRSH